MSNFTNPTTTLALASLCEVQASQAGEPPDVSNTWTPGVFAFDADRPVSDLIEMVKSAGGAAVVTINGITALMVTPDQASPWDPALRVVQLSSTETVAQ